MNIFLHFPKKQIFPLLCATKKRKKKAKKKESTSLFFLWSGQFTGPGRQFRAFFGSTITNKLAELAGVEVF